VRLLSYFVKSTVAIHSRKFFEVSPVCLEAFSDSCDQRSVNIRSIAALLMLLLLYIYIYIYIYIKVMQSRYRSGVPQRVPGS